MGQNTRKILEEIGDDLAGMGAGDLIYNEDNMMMIRPPTDIIKDPAMM